MAEEKEYALDVIVPTHNHLDMTMRCMETLYSHTGLPFHLIVVDDSTDLTPLYFAQFQKEHNNVTFVHSDEPYKCGNQIFNAGLAHAKTEFVATVMNSVRVEPGWDTIGLQVMKTEDRVGVLGFKCLYPNGMIESAGIKMNSYLPCDIGRDMPSHRLSFVFECDAVQWAFALLRKEAVVGNLEEDVFHGFVGFDDIDNSFVVKSKGWRVLACGLGVAYHTPRATRGDDSGEAFRKNQENGEIFYKRWGLWEAFQKAHPSGGEMQTLPREYWDKYVTEEQEKQNKNLVDSPHA